MAGVNKVILIGNLGADPEVRHINEKSVVARFNIATSESYTNKNGERVEQTEWHKIELWDDLAKRAEKYLRKGDIVYIEGKIRSDDWQDKEGNNRTTIRIRGSVLTFIGGYRSNQSSEKPMPEATTPEPTTFGESLDDDLPF